MQPSLQLRHDSGRPALVTPHTSQVIVFFDLGNFFSYVLPEGSCSSFSVPGLGNVGFSLVPASTTILDPYCVIPQL